MKGTTLERAVGVLSRLKTSKKKTLGAGPFMPCLPPVPGRNQQWESKSESINTNFRILLDCYNSEPIAETLWWPFLQLLHGLGYYQLQQLTNAEHEALVTPPVVHKRKTYAALDLGMIFLPCEALRLFVRELQLVPTPWHSPDKPHYQELLIVHTNSSCFPLFSR